MIWILTAVGLAVGALLPRLIAHIPDREPAVESLPRHERAEPPPASDQAASDRVTSDRAASDRAASDRAASEAATPYRELAAAPGLPLLLAVATAVTWVGVVVARGVQADLAAYLVVGALGVAMGYVDLREFRLPDWLTLPAFGAAAVLLGVAAAVDGDWSAYGRAWLGAAASVAFYLLLALLRPSDLGLGDVKLSGALGLILGWAGWPELMLGIFLGFAVGGIVGIALLLAGRAGRRSSIPFGPPMLVGALLALLWGSLIAEAYIGI